MSFLYIGTFGSFIGYSFAFGLVLQNQFGRTPLQAAYVTFIGPLLGSLIRPVGGRLADRYGGARITLVELRRHGRGDRRSSSSASAMRSRWRCSPSAFIVLFVLTGLGNGSTYKMIPGIFQARRVGQGLTGEDGGARYGRRLSGASMGLIGAVGALGGARHQPRLPPVVPHRGVPAPAPSSPSSPSTRSASRSPGPYTFAGRRAAPAGPTAAAEAKPQLSYAEVST